MELSMNLILDQLKEYHYDSYIAQRPDVRFSRLCLLPETVQEISEKDLYIGELSAALNFKKQGVPLYCICIRDRIQDKYETEEMLSGLVVINENVSFRKIYNEVHELFYSIGDWIEQMKQCVYEKRTLQELLKLSKPIIGNFISVSDSAFCLIAYTDNIEVDDPISVKLIQNGYHPDETIESFKITGQYEIWDRTEGLVINTIHDLSPYDLCSKVFKNHNTYYVHIVMTCNNRPLTNGTMELFRILADVVGVYLLQEWKQLNYCRHVYDSLLIDLIENEDVDKELVSDRSKLTGIPLNADYRLYLIDFKAANIPIGRIGMDLANQFTNVKVITYENSILALVQLRKNENRKYEQFRSCVLSIANEYQARCAVSAAFQELIQMRRAYYQTKQLLQYCSSIADFEMKDGEPEDRIFEYDDYFLLLTVSASPGSDSMWKSTKYYRLLKQLQEYDKKHNTNNVFLLYTYLHCDCKTPEASEALHMHRNNVLYRIRRIEEILQIDLNDPKLKNGFRDSQVFIKLYGLDG